MIWIDLLKQLDELRSKIRQAPEFKNQRAVIVKEHPLAVALLHLAEEIQAEASAKTVTVEIGADGKPIIPDTLADLFATAPSNEIIVPVRDPNAGAKVQRRNPPQGAAAKAAEVKATVLPRDTPHIIRKPDLEDADENTVAK